MEGICKKSYNSIVFLASGNRGRRQHIGLAHNASRSQKGTCGLDFKMRFVLGFSSAILFAYCVISSACIHTLVEIRDLSQSKISHLEAEVSIYKLLQHTPRELSQINI